MSITRCEDPCPPQCRSVFDRVWVSRLTRGGTKVSWMLLPDYVEPNPLSFQLQVGTTSNPLADDWTDVGLPVENQYTAFDSEQRVFGKTANAWYRVVVTSANGVDYSLPTGAMGTLNQREWLIARDIIRQRRVLYRVGAGSNAQLGYLLKRRWTGARCSCLDIQTNEVRDPECQDCYGTGFVCGYYYPAGCIWASLGLRSYRTELDGGQSRGTVNDVYVPAEMLATDILDEDDVWVNKLTDERYYVHRVQHVAELRGVPLILKANLSPIPYSSVIYTIPIPEQLAALEA